MHDSPLLQDFYELFTSSTGCTELYLASRCLMAQQSSATMNAEKTASQDRLGKHLALKNTPLVCLPYSLFYTYINPDTEPTLKDLSNKVAPKVVVKVEVLALQLGLQKYDVAAIQRSHPLDPQGQALAVFSKWHDLDQNYTWKFLIEALRAEGVGLYHLANVLEQWLTESMEIN